MEGLKSIVVSQVLPLLGSVFVVVLSSAIIKVKQVLQRKLEKDTFEFAKSVSVGIYKLLEDTFKESGMGERKKKEMEYLLKQQFPNLSQTELDAINKEVHLLYQRAREESFKLIAETKPWKKEQQNL